MGALGGRALTIAALAGTLAFGAAGFQPALAQDATPVGEAQAGPAYPNHIHQGTCDNLNPAPVAPLADLHFSAGGAGEAAAMMMATPEGAMASPAAGAGEAIPVAVATTEAPMSLDDIIAGGHALNVHSSEDIAVYIACGNINGTPDEQGNLFIGLGELNDSGYSGVAWFLAQGDSTTVTVFLTHAGAMGAAGMAGEMGNDVMATPAA